MRRVKALRPMFRGYTCFSPAALHQHWYRQHPFLRAATPEVRLCDGGSFCLQPEGAPACNSKALDAYLIRDLLQL